MRGFLATVRLILITALRDRLYSSILGLEVVALASAVFLGGAMMFEQRASVLAFGAGLTRIAVVLGLTIFTAFHVERLYGTKEIEAILSRTISRHGFMIAYWAGLVVMAIAMVMPLIVFVVLFQVSKAGLVWWAASLVMECALVLAFALFAALILERAIPTIFLSIGFYFLCRMLSFFLGIATHGPQNGLNRIANPVFEAIAMLLPRLDLFSQSRWLVYGPSAQDVFFWMPLQTAIYVPLLLAVAAIDLRRKSF